MKSRYLVERLLSLYKDECKKFDKLSYQGGQIVQAIRILEWIIEDEKEYAPPTPPAQKPPDKTIYW